MSHVTGDFSSHTLRGNRVVTHWRTDCSIITDILSRLTVRRSWGVADRRTDGSIRHAVIATPATAIRSHVADSFCSCTVRWCWGVTDHGTDGALRHAEGSHPASGIESQVTPVVSCRTVAYRWSRTFSRSLAK